MEWIQGQVTRTSVLDTQIKLYRVNNEVYDEIEKRNGLYYLIRRCGVEPYSIYNIREDYVTDGQIIIYPLNKKDVVETMISLDELKAFSEITSISINNGVYSESNFTFDVDHRYVECVDYKIGSNIDIETGELDENRDSYVYSIKNINQHSILDGNLLQKNQHIDPNLILNTSEYIAQDNDTSFDDVYPVKIPSYKDNDGKYITPLVKQRKIELSDLQPVITDDGNELYPLYFSQDIDKNYAKGKWYCFQFKNCGCTKENIENVQIIDQYDYEDLNLLSSQNIGRALTTNYTVYAYTYIYVDYNMQIAASFARNNQAYLYVNGQVVNANVGGNTAIILKRGLNLIEAVVQNTSGNGYFALTPNLSTLVPEGSLGYISKILTSHSADFEIKTDVPVYGSKEMEVGDKIYRETDAFGVPGDWILEKNIDKCIIDSDTVITQVSADEDYSTYCIDLPIRNDDSKINVLNDFMKPIEWDYAAIPKVTPRGYTDVEYITSQQSLNGYKAKFDTQIPANTISHIEMRFQLTKLASQNQILFSIANNGSYWGALTSSGVSGAAMTLQLDQPLKQADVLNQGFKNVDFTITCNTDGNMCIGSWDSSSYSPEWQIDYIKIYNKQNELVSHFMPVIRNTDSKSGFYDIIRCQFYNCAQNNGFGHGSIISYAPNVNALKYETLITSNDNKIYMRLPTQKFPTVDSIRIYNVVHPLEFYYVLPESTKYNVLNQVDLNMLSEQLLKHKYKHKYYLQNTLIPLVVEESDILCTIYRSNVRVCPNKTYNFLAFPNGSNWVLFKYYDMNNRLLRYGRVGVSDLFHVPEDVYYVNLIDLTNTIDDDTDIQVNSSYGHQGPISTLNLNNNGLIKEINLPHILEPGDELYYDKDMSSWIYYPRRSIEDFIKYSTEEFPEISISGSLSCQEDLEMSAYISSKKVRKLSRVNNVFMEDYVYTGENGYGYITFDETIGATSYDVYIDDVYQFNINNEKDFIKYSFLSEQSGFITLVAKNEIQQSTVSNRYKIYTVANSPHLEQVDTIFQNNRYYVTINFKANSILADYYDVVYSLDGSNPIVYTMEHDKVFNEMKTVTFTTPTISDNLVVQVTASNKKGRNDYVQPVTLSTNNGFEVWTYKTAINKVLMAWRDTCSDESDYMLKYSRDGGETWDTIISEGRSGYTNERLLEYIDLDSTSELKVCLATIRNGYTNIFTKPISVSKALDKTLIAPAHFEGNKLESGEIQFVWEDNYNVDANFELYYTYSDGTATSVTIKKQSSTTGNYTYIYNPDDYGFATAKIKMVWDLGESVYSDDIVVYNIPVVEQAPIMLPRQRDGRTLTISWEPQQFVKNYTLYFSVNGAQRIIDLVDTEYNWDMPLDEVRTPITVAVKATFIDGSQTSVSKTVSFSLCNTDYKYNSLVYTHNEEDNGMYTTVMTKGLTTSYPDFMYSINTFFKEYEYYDKTYMPYLFTDYTLYDSYWGHGVGESYKIQTLIKSSHINDYDLFLKIYEKAENINDIHTLIYAPATVSYPIYTEVTKLIIACFGDSITAGHPNYWAETGTGDITSQYEYWLSRRLKDEYDVVNKGYGQEKTNDMLERFDRDIKGLGAHYCIILGGTNDWYQDASTKDLATGYTVMDSAIDNIKQIVSKCWDNNIYPIVCTLTPRNDITEDGKRLFEYFNDWVKEWTTQQSIIGKDCAYIDFFNAGKDLDPPIPLEDPDKPYHLNPLCDGDNVYDEAGNMIRSGLGVHMNIQGYKVMGQSIPLTLFATGNTGFKLYKDSKCTNEEFLNKEELSNQFYEISVQNVRRGIEKNVIRYIKNIGNYPCLYYIHITDEYNMDYYFVDEDGNKKKYLVGSCNAGMVKPLNIVINTGFDDYVSSFKVHLVSRELTNVKNNL